ncbi:hypothetical protein GEMRC1_009820 [Eukaryota sp. GEM-RC1]
MDSFTNSMAVRAGVVRDINAIVMSKVRAARIEKSHQSQHLLQSEVDNIIQSFRLKQSHANKEKYTKIAHQKASINAWTPALHDLDSLTSLTDPSSELGKICRQRAVIGLITTTLPRLLIMLKPYGMTILSLFHIF